MTISIQDFSEIDLRVAEIKAVEEHPNADKLLVLKIDTGDGEKQLVAGIKNHYSAEELVGRKIIVINNLAPVVLRGVESQGMLLAARDDDKVVLLTTEKDVKPGSRVQ
ncbi:MAG: methionine--tRNA ligase subunit beta [Planctomycetes bacterium GWF2_40_8]|nr:MAG: methionine--tRNA ligase subunit beta [Planctomycetes bacterium GWF2_40_8]OHB86728.1 MAG: methionine--tRNA ligase subunit beta [Planctomycetes bacterium RIFCSPHIGHO2_02_FULL_40_12]OHC03483.1 MAG: methionine--tRNA ligase subunit beta [Planctomycetes bacterium RIFCSPLOWO2_12_FULL_40_19]